MKTGETGDGTAALDRSKRTYCVVICKKGKELYPVSMPMQSGVKKFRRGMEAPKTSTDLEYVGVYTSKQAAVDAFSLACAAIPLERRAFAYSDTPTMYIGARTCRRYLHCTDSVLAQY